MQQYEHFRLEGWRSWDRDETDIGYPKVISYFVQRKPSDPVITGKVMQLHEETFDKCYSTDMVIRMITDKIFTKKFTKLKSGKKRRITPLQSFLNMKEYDSYTWISLLEEVRFATMNNIDVVYLSNKELKLIK